jgi:WD40 repeat protein
MIFISHSSKNQALAHAIAERLEGRRYARFLDLADLHGGDRWETRLHEMLNEARALVLCATPAALESKWVRKEVTLALGRGIPVIPCALERCRSRWHRELQWIDFTRDPDAGYARLFSALERIPALERSWPKSESPYPGLEAFDDRRASVYFGREDDLVAALDSLRGGLAGSVRTFVGPSGVGKSSFVRAALLPHLQSNPEHAGSLRILEPVRPGTSPLRALATALHALKPSRRSVRATEEELATPLGLHYALLGRARGKTCALLVDQLEEALSATPDEREIFFTRLKEAAAIRDSRLLLLCTLRSDFLTACLELPVAAELLRGGLHPLGVLDRAALRRAIVVPARQAGVAIDGPFVEEVLDDTRDGRALPLLMDALARLWPLLVRGDVDAYTTAYRESDRVAGGLAHRAGRIYREAGPDVQRSLQSALLMLADVDEEGRIRRRCAAKKELPRPVHGVVEALVSARLLVGFEEDGVEYVEVVHEALFTSWPLYAAWLAEAETHLRLSRRLERDAREWEKSGESPVYLWTGERLAAAEALLEPGDSAPVDHPVRMFLAASVAGDRRTKAREADLIAARIEAEHHRLPVVSLLAAAAAVERYGPTAQLERAIRSALCSFQGIAVFSHAGSPLSACLNPLGSRVVTCGYDGVINVFDVGTGERIHHIKAHDRAVIALSLDREGTRILSASRDSRVRIWNLSTGELLVDYTEHRAIISAAIFDASGTKVATASRDKTARVFDAGTGKTLFSFEHPDQVISVDFDGDGVRVVTGCQDRRARVFTLTRGATRPLLEFDASGRVHWHPILPYVIALDQTGGIQIVVVTQRGFRGPVGMPSTAEMMPVPGVIPGTTGAFDVRFDRTGTALLAVCSDGTVSVFSLPSGARQSALTGHEGDIVSARFAPGGAQVLTASRDGVARLYDVKSGIVIREFRGHAGALHSARFNDRDGGRVVTSSADGFVRVYSTWPAARGAVLAEHAAPCTALALDAARARAIAATKDGFLLIAALDAQAAVRLVRVHDRAIERLDLSPDGARAVTQPQYEAARVVDLATGEILHEAQGAHPNRAACFLPDGQLVVVDWQGTARRYDPEFRKTGQLELQGYPPAEIVVSPDGQRFAVVSIDGLLEVFSASWKRITSRRLGSNNQSHHLLYRPDGLQLACSFGQTLFLLDPVTLEIHREVALDGRSSIRYAPGGHALVVGRASQPGSVASFDSNTGTEIVHVTLTDGVEDAAFSHSGRLIVSGGADRAVRIFDARTGQALWHAFEHRGDVNRVEFGADDEAVFTASSDGTIRRFEFPSLARLLAHARRLAGRELSDDERRAYGLGPEGRMTSRS